MISVVLPIFNEAFSLPQLYKELSQVLKKIKDGYEIIFVNDGSTDQTQKEIDKCKKHDAHIVSIRLKRNFGKASALQWGFARTKGEIVVTLDSDLQDDPGEMKKLIAKLNEGYDLVVGWKKNRQDPIVKRLSSRLFNLVVNLIFKLNIHDYNSGYKVFRKEVLNNINLYGELHRFIPVFIAHNGYKVAELPVNHRSRKFGQSKYGSGRIFHGLFDLITVLFLTRFKYRPMHLFGYSGLAILFAGVIGGGYLTFLKLVYGQAIGQRPLLLLSVLLIIIGAQIVITGLLGELIVSIFLSNDDQQLPKTHQ